MKRTPAQPLGDLLRKYVEANGMRRKLKEKSIRTLWGEILGEVILRRTNNIYIKNKTLFVYLDSSTVRNELMMMRGSIIEKINEHSGELLINNIVLR